MSSRRIDRLNELLRQEIAGYLYRIMNERGFDMSAVTVTRVSLGSDLRHATVMVSIRAAAELQASMLRQIANHRRQIQEFVGRTVVMKYTPQLSFELDASIAEGDRVLHIISELEAGHPEWPEPADEEGPKDEPPT
jgi:ribosome-binding factor A